MSTISENLALIQQEIAPYTPKIVAVTKYFDEMGIVNAYEAGLRDFGENRVQDALAKIEKLPAHIRENSKFHLIGHLQTNKVKKAVGVFDLIHSVDSIKLAAAISEEARNKSTVQKILLQVNTADEEGKFGFAKGEIEGAFEEILALEEGAESAGSGGIKIEGLMTIAPISRDEEYLRMLFREIIQIKDKITTKFSYNLNEISMGMSDDYGIAVTEGSTIIRIGRKLFQEKTQR